MTMQFTTLVPAYKPKYLVELLTALRHQTVKPAKIIFSDDSPDQAFITALTTEPLKSLVADLHVEVVPGPRAGGYNNFRHLLQRFRAQAEGGTALFHLLLDDDIIYPTFYERHLQAHSSAVVQCVISRRWTALESGQPTRDDLPVPAIVAGHAQRTLALDAPMLFAHTAGTSQNWLGEFSNTTFRAEMAPELDDISMAGISFAGLEDLGGFLKASLRGRIGYINDHLGFFRLSAEQNSANPMGLPLKRAFLAYIALAIAGRRLGRLTPEQSAQAVHRVSLFVLHHYGKEADMAALCAVMPRLAVSTADSDAEAQFLTLWAQFSGAPSPAAPVPGVMSPTPAISVVIPVYNGEAYLPQTLDALLAQDFRNFEVLCVDDCSTDGSLAVLQSYAARDSRVRVVRMDKNQGNVPLVLNQVLDQLRGQYFAYASQDDLFSRDWLAHMHARALETGADAVIPDVVFYYEHEPARCHSLVGLRGDRSIELTPREAVQYSLDWTIPGNALWNAALIQRLRYADFATNADEYSARVFFLHCNKVVFSTGQFLYRQDNAQAITKKITYKSFDSAYTFFRLYQFLQEHGFPLAVCQREALKSIQTLAYLRQWLERERPHLGPADIAEAQRRAQVCEDALRDHGVYQLFSPAESAT